MCRSDLKLDNLLLVTPGDIAHVKVVDFGVRAQLFQPGVMVLEWLISGLLRHAWQRLLHPSHAAHTLPGPATAVC